VSYNKFPIEWFDMQYGLVFYSFLAFFLARNIYFSGFLFSL
jgi:hypothetical protein